MYSTGHKYHNISTGVLVDFHMIHYIWEEVTCKVTGKAVAIFMTGTVYSISVGISLIPRLLRLPAQGSMVFLPTISWATFASAVLTVRTNVSNQIAQF